MLSLKAQGYTRLFSEGEPIRIEQVLQMDGNYPDYVRDSCITADVLFLPSWDWEAVSQQHYHESVFRATENGVAVVRATYDGVSTVYNKYGRALVESDSLKVGYDEVTFADVPIDGTVTFYKRCSGWINWMFLVMLVVAFRTIPRRSSEGYRVR